MHALYEELQCPLTRERDARDRQRLTVVFPALNAGLAPHYLALRRYLTSRPEKFYSVDAYEIYFNWLKNHDANDPSGLKEYLLDHQAEIDRALLFLREINSEAWHDTTLRKGDEYDLVRFIDKHIHPTYLRLVEAVFTPFLRFIAYFARVDDGKGTDGLDVWAVVDEVNRGPAKALTATYVHIIRNGIAHGGITFLQHAIRYRDKKGNEDSFSADEVVRMLDDLLDTCNGLAAALKVFFAAFRDRGYLPPREILIEELQEETATPWWRIEGCVEAQIIGKSQLTIFARPNTRDQSKVHWSAFQGGVLAEYFAPGYERYFFSLRSPKGWPGWAAFDGPKLREKREAGENELSRYADAIETGVIFFVNGFVLPQFLGRIETLWMSLRVNLPAALDGMRRNLQIPNIDCRVAAAHRNAWGAVTKGDVVIDGIAPGKVVETTRRHRHRIIRAAVRRARRHGCHAAWLPIAFAQVGVFRRDYRSRRLSSFGLDEDLVCTVRHQRLQRIQCPDIAGSTVEVDGNWRIAWNRAWLSDSGESIALTRNQTG
jgi:hypothetical protein